MSASDTTSGGGAPGAGGKGLMDWLSELGNLAQGPASQIYKDWEKWLAQSFEKLSRNESFLGQMAKALEGTFVLKIHVDRMLENSIKAMRLPTQGDLETVHARLTEIERRLDSLREQMEGSGAPARKRTPSGGAARTRARTGKQG
jgi:hypothetical protein